MFRLRLRKCKHPLDREVWLENLTVPCTGTVNGVPDQQFVVGGYMVRCEACGTKRFIPVG